MKSPLGSEVGLYYDGWARVEPGDALQTPTGRTYLVVSNRIQAKGEHVGRQHIRAVVISKHDVDPDTDIHPLHWYPRG